MEEKNHCDSCNELDVLQREVFLKNGAVVRVYDLCPSCWARVYRRCLEDFLEGNEYKVANYIKAVCDKFIGDNFAQNKLDAIEEELGKEIESISELNPDDVKELKGAHDD